MIETLVNFGPAAKKSQLTTSLYYKDTPGKMNVLDTNTTDAGANTGLKARNKFTRTSKSCDQSGPLHTDICFQELLIKAGVDIKVKLVRSMPEICLVAGWEDPAYKVVIEQAMLRRVTVSPTLRMDREKYLDKTTAKILYRE